MNLNHVHFNQCENLSQEKPFTSGQIFNKFHTVVAKSTTERGNSNNKTLANTSTPFNNRAFFVCSTRTPQENRLAVFLSMVGYSGRYFTDCLPLTTAFHTAVPYRQTVESLAVDSKNQLMESIKMNPYTLNAYTGNQSYTLNLTRSISDLGGLVC